MEDSKLKKVYDTIVKEGYDVPDYATFESDMRDDNKLTLVRDRLVEDGYDLPEFGQFKADMFGAAPMSPKGGANGYTFTASELNIPEDNTYQLGDASKMVDEMRANAVDAGRLPVEGDIYKGESGYTRTDIPLKTQEYSTLGEAREAANADNRKEALDAYRSAYNRLEQPKEVDEETLITWGNDMSKAPAEQMAVFREVMGRDAQNRVELDAAMRGIEETTAELEGLVGSSAGELARYLNMPEARREALGEDEKQRYEALLGAAKELDEKRAVEEMKTTIGAQLEDQKRKTDEYFKKHTERMNRKTGGLYSMRGGGIAAMPQFISSMAGTVGDKQWRTMNAIESLNSQSRGLIESSKDAKENTGLLGNVQNYVKEAVYGLADIENWLPVLTGMNFATIKGVIDKADEGKELTKDEEQLLEAIALNVATKQMYADDRTWVQDAGSMTGQMVPFMLEMAAGGMTAAGKGAMKGLAKWALKKFGKGASKSAKKAIYRTGAVTGLIGGAVGGGYASALTVGAPRTTAEVIRRTTGEGLYNVNEDGEVEYAGHKEGEGVGEAIIKGTTKQMLEYGSEIAGAGYVNLPFRWLQKTGKGTRLLGWMDNFANSDRGKLVQQFMERTGWHGPLEEFMEEIHVGLLDPDTPLDEFFTKKNLMSIALGVAVPGAVVSSFQTVGGIADGSFKAGAQEKWKMQRGALRAGEAWKERADEWHVLRNRLNNGNLDELDDVLTAVYEDPTLTDEQKLRALEYGVYSLQYRTAIGAREAMDEGRMSNIDAMLRDVYGEAFASDVSASAAKRSITALEEARANVQQILGMPGANIEDVMGDRSIEEVAEGDKEIEMALTKYFAAKADFEGRQDRFADVIDSSRREAAKSIDRTKNDDGNVYSAVLPTGETVYITGGKVVLDNEGYIDVNQSEGLVALMPDSSKKPLKPGDLREKVEVSNAEELKNARYAEIEDWWRTEFDAAENEEIPKTEVPSSEMTTEQKTESATSGGNVPPVEENAPVVQAETAQPVAQTALERVPKAENGEPVYEQADADTAWDAIMEQANDEELATQVVEGMIADKEAALKKLENSKVREGVTVAEKIAAAQQRKAAIEQAKADLAKWQEIAGVKAKRAETAAVESAPVEAAPVVEQVAPVESAPVAEEAQPAKVVAEQPIEQVAEVAPVQEESGSPEIPNGSTVSQASEQVVDHYTLNSAGNSTQMQKDMEALRKSNRDEYSKIQPAYELLKQAKERGLYPNELEELRAIVKGTSLESKVDGWFTPVMAEGESVGQSGVAASGKVKTENGKPVNVNAHNVIKSEDEKKALRKRAEKWAKKLGVKVHVLESYDEVTDEQAKVAILEQRTPGWFAGGEVYIYMPHLVDEVDLDKTVVHESVAHKGIKQMLGEEFNKFLDNVWNAMSVPARAKFLSYVGAGKNATQADRRAAADEYVAALAEKVYKKQGMTAEEKNIWQKFADWFRKKFNVDEAKAEVLSKETLTDEDIAKMIRASYETLQSNKVDNEVASVDGGRAMFSKEVEEVNEKFNNELQQQIDGTLPEGHIYQLGMPSSKLLAAEIDNLPIELPAWNLLVKSKKDYKSQHPYNLSDVKDLVRSVHNPIAVFDSEEQNGKKVILTELKDKKDRNFIAVLDIRRRGGRNYVEINSVISLYPKDSAIRIAKWFDSEKAGLTAKGEAPLLKWADKNKTLIWLSSHSSDVNAAGLSYKRIANIVSKFEKTNTESEKSASDGTKFRKDDATLIGTHSLTEEKLRKAIKMGGLANPSTAIFEMGEEMPGEYGEITFVMPSSMVDKKTGRNTGAFAGDAWTPTYPQVERQMSKRGGYRAREDVQSVPKEMQKEVKMGLDSWLDGREGAGLAYLFLQEEGMAPELSRVAQKYSDEVRNRVSEIAQGEPFYRLSPEQKQQIVDLFVEQNFNGDVDNYNGYLKEKVAMLQEKLADENTKSFIKKSIQQYIDGVNEYGYEYEAVSDFLNKVQRNINHSGAVNDMATTQEAARIIREKGLEREFQMWKEELLDRYEIKEVIFKGFTPTGNRKYVPHTLENVSKDMKEQGRNGAVGLNASFSKFAAGLLKPLNSLDAIRKRKGNLRPTHADTEAFKNKWSEVYYDLAEKLQPDAKGYEDYGLDRVAEAATKKDPKAFIKSEYGIELSKADEKALKDMIWAIQNEYPVMYFETKFERPVYLDEFAGVVIPENTGSDVVESLENAGLKIETYEPGNEKARAEAIKRLTEEDDRIMFRRANENQEIFMSNARKAVEEIKQEKATPQQWLAMIKKNGGLKAGEDKWMGLSEWLENNESKSLTKQEVLDFVNENAIKIEEVHYDTANEMEDFRRPLEKSHGKDFADKFIKAFDIEYGEFGIYDEQEAVDLYNEANGTDMQYDEDSYDVGAIVDWAEGIMKEVRGDVREIYHTRLDYTTDGLNNKREIALTVPTVESYNIGDYTHFGDAGNGRAVAWVRFGETTDSEGNRVLVIDEIQSKRHQEGREKGYGRATSEDVKSALEAVNAAQSEFDEYNAEMAKKYGSEYDWNIDATDAEIDKWQELYDKVAQLGQVYEDVAESNRKGIPSAPFEKNWHELAMKRMLRLAAEEGFDKVAWTTGEQQAERYNMSRGVDFIQSEDNNTEMFSDGTSVAKDVHILTTVGSVINLKVGNDGIIHGGEFDGKNLAELVGKELAVKLMQPGNIELEGEGLKVGGEGMKAFYDRMLPSFVSKYTKKWAAKVGTVEMPNLEQNNVMHSVDVTPEMKESVMEGQTMFRFIGEKGAENLDKAEEATTRLDNLNVAREMETGGKDAKAIKLATGWERGADGKWRYETDDDFEFDMNANVAFGKRRPGIMRMYNRWRELLHKKNALAFEGEALPADEGAEFKSLSSDFNGTRLHNSRTLKDYIDAPELFEAYPEVADIKVSIEALNENEKGSYSPIENIIRLNNKLGKGEIKSTLNHEIQHAIQHIEGFATGGNVSSAATYLNLPLRLQRAYEIVAQMDEPTVEKIYEYTKRKDISISDKVVMQKLFFSIRDGMVSFDDVLEATKNPYGVYKRLAGEVESRNVQKRLGMTPEQRRNELATETEDVSRKDQIFIYDALANEAEATGGLTEEVNSQEGETLFRKAEQDSKEARKKIESLDNETMETVKNLAVELNTPVAIVTDIDSIADERKRKAAIRGDKGWFDLKNGVVTIVMPNIADEQDAVETMLHEIVGHRGLRGLLGDKYNEFLNEVFVNAPKKMRAEIMRIAMAQMSNGSKISLHTAVEEYLAGIAEGGFVNNPTLWTKIMTAVKQLLRSIGVKVDVSENELAYMLWRSYQLLKSGYNLESNIMDSLMQQRMEAGAYRSRSTFLGPMRSQGRDLATKVELAHVRGTYERRVRESGFQAREALQDSMFALKEFQKLIEKATGKKLPDYFNAYYMENALSSANQAQAEAYGRLFYSRIVDAISELKKRVELDDIYDYLMIKHGIERNREMALKASLSNDEGALDKKMYNRYAEAKKKILEDADKNKTKWEEVQRELDSLAKSYGADLTVDYSGLSSIFKEKDFYEAAYKHVLTMDEQADFTELHKAIKNATDETLKKRNASGFMSKATKDEILDMYQYYVPLRGFEETTADEMYNYMTVNYSPIPSIKRARGRKSKAENPIAWIANAAEAAIVQGNRNMMKLAFYNGVAANPNDLVSIEGDIYIQKVNGQWVVQMPDIPANATAEEVEEIMTAHNERMKEMARTDKSVKRVTDSTDIPFTVVQNSELKEHQIFVRRNGKLRVMTVNGNPRLAQAINGMTNPNNSSVGMVKWFEESSQAINSGLSKLYTTANPDFILSNWIRDMIYSNSMVWVKESPAYAALFNKNCTLNAPGVFRLLLKYEDDKLNMEDPVERMFHEFMVNGGETGYTKLKDVEAQKKKLKKMLESNGVKDGAKAVEAFIGQINRAVENAARFAAYRTSREMGRSITRSIYDAKEISVNFNKKGAGARFVGTNGQTVLGNTAAVVSGVGRGGYVFWNAGVQGMNNFFTALFPPLDENMSIKDHAVRYSKSVALIAVPLALGYLAASMGADDDEYQNLSPFVRRSNLCFKLYGNTMVTIPLPIEYRAIYGTAEYLASVANGKEEFSAWPLAEQLSQLMPIDMLEGGGGAKAFIPSLAKPIYEGWTNTDWMGSPIAKLNDFNKLDPEYRRVYENVSAPMVGFSRMLNELGGGNRNRRASISNEASHDAKTRDLWEWTFEWNPAILDNTLSGYAGGYYSFPSKVFKTGEMIFGDLEFDWKHVPFLNRVLKTSSEKAEEYRINEKYFDNLDVFEKDLHEMKGWEKNMIDIKLTEEEREKVNEKYSKLLEKNDKIRDLEVIKSLIDINNSLYKELGEDAFKQEMLKSKMEFNKKFNEIYE